MDSSENASAILYEVRMIAEQLKRSARRAFLDATEESDDFGKRLIEHGGTCYVNAAEQLDRVLTTYDGYPSMVGDLDDGLFRERGRTGDPDQLL